MRHASGKLMVSGKVKMEDDCVERSRIASRKRDTAAPGLYLVRNGNDPIQKD